jgi:hypothetical protein
VAVISQLPNHSSNLRGESALASNLLAVNEEENGHGEKGNCEEAKKRHGLQTHLVSRHSAIFIHQSQLTQGTPSLLNM